MRDIKTIGVFLASLGAGYLVIVFFILVIPFQISILHSVWPLEAYIGKHAEELKINVFEKTFSDAGKCLKITEPEEKRLCQSQIGRELGGYLDDDELGGSTNLKYLFFVKESNNKFYSLDWRGELFSEQLGTFDKVYFDNRLMLVKPFLEKCQFFSKWPNTLLCEVFAPIKIDNQTQGYLGWKMYYRDGGDYGSVPFFIAYAILIFPLIFVGYFFNSSIGVSLLALLGLTLWLLPWIIAGYVTWRYDRKASKK